VTGLDARLILVAFAKKYIRICSQDNAYFTLALWVILQKPGGKLVD
jgi:ribulose bisphosphate carboxylase small subunit